MTRRQKLGRNLLLNARAAIALTILLCGVCDPSRAQPSGAENLLVNHDLRSGALDSPADWKQQAVPDCGSRFILHNPGAGSGELEIINDEPGEAWFEQTVKVKPGWYHLTAEVKIESIGSDGAGPQLFVRTQNSTIEVDGSPLGFRNDWQTNGMYFKTGPLQREVAVGGKLGIWGRPNTGRLLFRSLSLVSVAGPIAAEQGHDLEELASSRYPGFFGSTAPVKADFSWRRWALPEKSPADAKAVLPNQRWSIIAVYVFFALVAALGWYALSCYAPPP